MGNQINYKTTPDEDSSLYKIIKKFSEFEIVLKELFKSKVPNDVGKQRIISFYIGIINLKNVELKIDEKEDNPFSFNEFKSHFSKYPEKFNIPQLLELERRYNLTGLNIHRIEIDSPINSQKKFSCKQIVAVCRKYRNQSAHNLNPEDVVVELLNHDTLNKVFESENYFFQDNTSEKVITIFSNIYFLNQLINKLKELLDQ